MGEPRTWDLGDPPTIRTLETGARREAKVDDDVRYDLIPLRGLRRVAQTMCEGGKHYGEYNWEKGMPIPMFLNHCIEHLVQYMSGDSSEDHLGHAAANLHMAMDSEERWPNLPANEALFKAMAERKGKTGI